MVVARITRTGARIALILVTLIWRWNATALGRWLMIPNGSGVSGDGLSRAYAAGHFVYPVVDVWGWVRERRDS